MRDTATSRNRRPQARSVSPERLGRALVIVLLLAALVVTLLNILIRPEAPQPSSWSSVSVGASGTLWEIAASHPIEGLTTAQAVTVIQHENGLSSGTVFAGQVLRVPAQGQGAGVTVARR